MIITPFPDRSSFVAIPLIVLKFLLLMIGLWWSRLRMVLELVGVGWRILVECSTCWLVHETHLSFVFSFNLDGIMKCIRKRIDSQKLHLLLNEWG